MSRLTFWLCLLANTNCFSSISSKNLLLYIPVSGSVMDARLVNSKSLALVKDDVAISTYPSISLYCSISQCPVSFFIMITTPNVFPPPVIGMQIEAPLSILSLIQVQQIPSLIFFGKTSCPVFIARHKRGFIIISSLINFSMGIGGSITGISSIFVSLSMNNTARTSGLNCLFNDLVMFIINTFSCVSSLIVVENSIRYFKLFMLASLSLRALFSFSSACLRSVISLNIPKAHHLFFIFKADRESSTGNSGPSFLNAVNSSVLPITGPSPVILNLLKPFLNASIYL